MKNFLYIAFTISLLTSCRNEEFKLDNPDNQVLILGHGGMGVDSPYPMNTAESILKCLSAGADGTEMDIQMTSDSVLVAYHDDDLSTKTSLSGSIISKTWAEVQEAVYLRSPHLTYRIAKVDDLMGNIDNLNDILLSFDIKLFSFGTPGYKDQFARALIRLIEKHNLVESLIIEAKDKDFINMIQEKVPNSRFLYYANDFDHALEFALAENLYGITMSTRLITKEQIKKAHENNLRVALWNLHSNRSAREAIRNNADMIQVEKLDAALRMLE